MRDGQRCKHAPDGATSCDEQNRHCAYPACVDPAADTREDTMFLDCNGTPIRLGDVLQVAVTCNERVHGSWAQYRVRKAPGGYMLDYHCSEKGAIMPPGYAGNYMADALPEEDELDLKTLFRATVPLPVSGWRIVPPEEVGKTFGEERGR